MPHPSKSKECMENQSLITIRTVLFFVLIFGLPHVLWIPRKLGVTEEAIPLGVLNILFLLSFTLYLIGRSRKPVYSNPFKAYSLFMLIVVAGVGIALVMGVEENSFEVLKTGKNELLLLSLYFLPLVCIKTEKEFLAIFAAFIIIDFVIGIEVLRSGVLAGSHFHDMKRGAGPFGQGFGWQGSDIAAGYLAQELIFFVALLFEKKIGLILRAIIALMGLIMSLGLFATYARGAFLAVIVGIVFIFLGRGLKLKHLISFILLLGILTAVIMPESFKARISGVEKGELDESSLGRLYYYRTAFLIIKNHPFGVGTGQIRSFMEKYTRGGSLEEDSGKYVDPHNSFLYMTCEYGLLGLGLFMAFIIQLSHNALTIARMDDDDYPTVYKVYALGMFGLIGVFITVNMFYANFFKDLIMGTVVLHFGMLAYIKADIQRKTI